MSTTVSLRAAVYTRFSHADGDSDSCAIQLDRARQAVEGQGWTLTEAREDDGISGREMVRRPGLNALLERAKAGVYDVLVCRDMDRLFRGEAGRVLGILQLLQDQGVRVWEYTRKDFVRLDGEHVLMTAFKAYGNRSEAMKTSVRIKEKLKHGDEAGTFTCAAPFGLKNQRRHKHTGEIGVFLDWSSTVGVVVRDEEQFPVLLLIGELFLKLGTYNAVAVELNRRGVRDPAGTLRWQGQTVRAILVNPTYRGKIVRSRRKTVELAGSIRRVPNEPEEIRTYDRPDLKAWDDETIAKIDAQIQARVRNTTWAAGTRKHLSSTFVRCPCGGSITITSSTRSKYKSYCCNYLKSKSCTAALGYRSEPAVDAAVIEACMALLGDEVIARAREIVTKALDVREQNDTRLVEHDRLTRDIATTEKRIHAVEEMAMDSEGSERARHRATLRELLQRQEGLQEQLRQLDAQEAPPNPKALLEDFDARVAELRGGLAKGGVSAFPAVQALLQGERLTATRTPEGRWELRGSAGLRVFYQVCRSQTVYILVQ